MGNKPVNWVSWYDQVRFCNWLHNGQPSGLQDGSTTEDGAYTLAGATSIGTGSDPTHGANGRNAGALFWLPSENEWYKAAYYDPRDDASGGPIGDDNYWFYPTRNDPPPTIATADLYGNIDNDTTNIANYAEGTDWNGQNGNVTTVGSGGPGSASFYGAFDMGGNVGEWTEQIYGAFTRTLRGGNFGGAWPSWEQMTGLAAPRITSLRASGFASPAPKCSRALFLPPRSRCGAGAADEATE